MKKLSFILVLSLILFSQCKKEDKQAPAASNLDKRSVGASANELLSASKYSAINIQIQYMPGYAPDVAALGALTTFLDTLCNKPGGITITQTAIPGSGKSVLALTDITALETANRTAFTSGGTLSIYLIYVDAPYTTANVLGVAFRNTAMVVFGPTVVSNSGGINQASRTKLESTVTHHEFGHLLGLTNLGSPMVVPHEDASHAGHCNNSACLMYYITQTSAAGGIIMNTPVPRIDANCRNDLRANGGR